MVELKRGTAPPLLDPPMIMTERKCIAYVFWRLPCSLHIPCNPWLISSRVVVLPNVRQHFPTPFFPWQSKHSSISVSHVFLTLLLLHYTLSHQGYNWNIVKSSVTKKKRVCTATKKTPKKGGEWSWGDLI
jgi:hypothetical protein